ncbi:penicillin-binding transpeptidase domain-containing protein [Pseudalkalibacillus berkeleyi]|uniref:Penicillin-binding protein 2 n=1 Tax=Pseudalkalibacillus berkeleyi TaxID=1069813 RepID=A0ABS9H292_9BACL|nr:penicillin-binding transpeptidase domain-containing protein [Pseudalkalibacillus berkeleyi]MCF6138036.1 penicillin-binding protein 2 [Pseudalkalibacillus berkeleyi]
MKYSKRLYQIAIIFILILVVLIGRLAQIQLIEPLSFSKHQVNLIEASVNQRTHSVALDDGRGKLNDRFGELLHEIHVPAIILFPFLYEEKEKLTKVAEILPISSYELESQLTNQSKPLVLRDKITSEMIDEVNDLKIQGAYGQMLTTDGDPEFAFHFIGAIRQNPNLVKKRYKDRVEKGLIHPHSMMGVSGLQYAFDPFLISEGESKLIYHVQQSGRPLFGLDVKYTAPANPYYPVHLQTTLDQQAQTILEDAFNQANITKGGAVLLDVETSDMLGMISRPLPPKKDPEKPGTENAMLLPQTPGSIFKIVTAAAAIERNHNIEGRKFNCSQNTYNDGVEARELGILSFEESFYQSCNYTFATLLNEMMEQDAKVLDQYGEMLGLTKRVGWTDDVFHLEDFRHYPTERKNTLWADETDRHVSRAISQTAIGQLNVQLSPISVANMMATIARGGEQKQVRAAQSVLYKNGNTLVEFEEKESQSEPLSHYTIKKLQSLLTGVVQNPKGTGYPSFHNLPWGIAGKSGTAEKGDKSVYNKWFTGYFPANNPKYALVVVDLEADSSSTSTNKVFAQIVEQLYSLEHPDRALGN